VVVDGFGEVQRVVALVALRITKNDDSQRMLVQIGKWSDGVAQVTCLLPGTKCELKELRGDAMERLLQSKLAALAGHVVVSRIDREVEHRSSNQYKVRTKYLRTVYHAHLDDEAVLLPIVTSATGDGTVGMFPSLCTKRESMKSSSLPDTVPEWAHNSPIYFIPTSDSTGNFYAWLEESEFEQLGMSAVVHHVKDWLEALILPCDLKQTADSDLSADSAIDRQEASSPA